MKFNRKRFISYVFSFLIAFAWSGAAIGVPVNLLANPGFETGSFAGWTVDGNSIHVGVATDGELIADVDPLFAPAMQNVRSGSFAGNAVVRTDPIEMIILSQTIAVVPDHDYEVGFWFGHDSASHMGLRLGNSYTQISIDGLGLLTPLAIGSVDPGSTENDFRNITASFNSGSRTSIEVTFAITASGTGRAGVSFDDFYVLGEAPAAQVSEPGTFALLGLGLAGLGLRRRKRK